MTAAALAKCLAQTLTRHAQGLVALSLCTAAHPLHTRFTNMFAASVSEATLRPNPRHETERDVPLLEQFLAHFIAWSLS